jgi:hypothetical protein
MTKQITVFNVCDFQNILRIYATILQISWRKEVQPSLQKGI